MVHTKYYDSMPCDFRQEDVFHVSLYKPIKNVTPGAGHFWPEGHNLNKLGRGLLGDATY